MSAVVTRQQAGLRPPRSVSTNVHPGGPDGGVTVHYLGSGVGGAPWDHSRCASIWRAVQAYHMDHNGWADIAYSEGACPHGFVFEGRGRGVRTAAQGTNDGNDRSLAVCAMIGQGDDAGNTDALRVAVVDGADSLGAGPNRWPHNFWHSTDCPGPLDPWVRSGMPRPGAAPVPAQGGAKINGRIVAVTSDPQTGGYAEIGSDGGVFCYGARFWGSMGGHALAAPVVDGAYTPSGGGYWLVAADGGIFAFGDAHFFGSMGGTPLNAPIKGIAPTASGGGYWLVAEDGGIFAFGDARFLGSAA